MDRLQSLHLEDDDKETYNELYTLTADDIRQTGVTDEMEIARILVAVKTIAANTAGSEPVPQDQLLEWSDRFILHHRLVRNPVANVQPSSSRNTQPATCRRISKEVLGPHHPFPLHKLLFERTYAGWPDTDLGPPPIWIPTPQGAACTNLARFMDGFRGDMRWDREKTGNPITDWKLFQELSFDNPEAFWPEILRQLKICFHKPPKKMVQEAVGPSESTMWLPGAQMNIAESCFRDRDPDAVAIVFADENDPTKIRSMTYGELEQECRRVVASIQACGYKPGDRLAIFLPFTIESVIIYLSVILSGCIVVSIAETFAPDEIATRLRISGTSGVFTQEAMMRTGRAIPLYSRMLQAQCPPAIVLPAVRGAPELQVTLRIGDMSWQAFLDLPNKAFGSTYSRPVIDSNAVIEIDEGWPGLKSKISIFGTSPSGRSAGSLRASPTNSPRAGPLQHRPSIAGSLTSDEDSEDEDHKSISNISEMIEDLEDPTPEVEAEVAPPNRPINILFSSGTTGEPKAVPWTHSTPIRCGADAYAHMDIRERDVVCWPTSLGWSMGPWVVFASLLNSATLAIFEGPPASREFGRFVQAARVTMLGVLPSIVKQWRATKCLEGLDWGMIRCFSSSGEASANEDYHWLCAFAGYKPIIEYCGGAEVGGAFLSGTMLQPSVLCTFTTPTIGARIALIGTDGQQSVHGDTDEMTGEVALLTPMLGLSQRLLNKDHHHVYYKDMPMLKGTMIPLRRHGDELERLAGGYYRHCGRVDDTMVIAGSRVSSVQLERVCSHATPGISDLAAVGLSPPEGGPEQLYIVAVLTPEAKERLTPEGLRKTFQEALKEHVASTVKIHEVLIKDALPRTNSKLTRRKIRDEIRRLQKKAAGGAAVGAPAAMTLPLAVARGGPALLARPIPMVSASPK